MKKLLLNILLVLLVISQVGCNKDHAGKKAEELIQTMITYSTYSDVDKNKDNLPTLFEAYFTEEGYKNFAELQMGYVYPEFFRLSQATSTTNIRIKEVKRVEKKEGIRVKYNLEYTVVYKSKQIKMKDQIILEVNKKNQVTEIIILNSSDVIEKMFLGIKIL